MTLRENIMKVSKELFVRYGIRSVSIDDICNELRISKKTFYGEFGQKKDLVEELLDSLLIDDKGLNSDCRRQGGGNVVDDAMSFRYPEIRERNKRNEKFMHDLLKYYPDIYDRFMDRFKKHSIGILKSYLEGGVKDGLIRPELLENEDSIALVQEYMFFAAEFAKKRPNGAKRMNCFELVADCFVHMVCSKEGMEYYDAKYRNKPTTDIDMESPAGTDGMDDVM